MTLDTRARRAAQGINRAVEVMEMARSTKQPDLLEPFQRYADTKERNRRRGAILVAGGIAVVLIAIVAVSTLGGRGGRAIPAVPDATRSRGPTTSVRSRLRARSRRSTRPGPRGSCPSN